MVRKRGLETQRVRAASLTADREIKRAHLVDTDSASRVSDVVERAVITNPRALGASIVRVRRDHGQHALVVEEIRTLGHRSVRVLRSETAALDRVYGRALAGVEVCPCVVANVICALFLVSDVPWKGPRYFLPQSGLCARGGHCGHWR